MDLEFAHTPSSTDILPTVQGRQCIAEQDKVVAGIVAASFPIQLGGAGNAERGWGSCLAVRADGASDLRSQIGSVLAAKSQAAGLRAIGAVTYIEVGRFFPVWTPGLAPSRLMRLLVETNPNAGQFP